MYVAVQKFWYINCNTSIDVGQNIFKILKL